LPARQVNRRVPRALDRICQRAMAKNPADRYPDALSLGYDLDEWIARRARARRLLQIKIGILAVLLAVAVIVVWPNALIAHRTPHAIQAADAPDRKQPEHQQPARAQTAAVQPSPAQPAVAQSAPRTQVPVSDVAVAELPLVGNRGSHVYHRRACPSASKMTESHRIEFSTVDEARAARYTACRSCKPDA
jgi:hypothetical protein